MLFPAAEGWTMAVLTSASELLEQEAKEVQTVSGVSVGIAEVVVVAAVVA